MLCSVLWLPWGVFWVVFGALSGAPSWRDAAWCLLVPGALSWASWVRSFLGWVSVWASSGWVFVHPPKHRLDKHHTRNFGDASSCDLSRDKANEPVGVLRKGGSTEDWEEGIQTMAWWWMAPRKSEAVDSGQPGKRRQGLKREGRL